MKYLVSALPEPGERPWKTAKKTTVDGWDREDEVEERGEPKTRHQLERMHAVFRNTLLMCVLSFPQFGQFDITRSWYEWFYGEDIGGRFPPPEDHVLAIAERNAWRKIHEKMHEGDTLKAAMLSVRQDTLFWTREVYEKIRTFSRGRPPTRTSMDFAPPQKGKNKSKGNFCTAAKQGRVVFIGGGPNCRTWSILRHIPKPGAPTPVRGRTPETLWGLPHLDQAAQTQLDDDSILILRQMYITSLARTSRAAVSLPGPRSFLEHPEDPVLSSSLPKAKECSSFWTQRRGSFGWRRTP